VAGNTNFDTLLATTLNTYSNKLTDNIFTSRAFFFWLTSKDRIKSKSGGAKIVEQLIYAGNNTAGSYSGYDTISLTAQEGISAAEYEWRQFAASIAISGIEEAKNNGEAELLDLLEAKVMQAEETIKEELDQMFFGDGTGNGGKDWNGLGNLIGTTGNPGNITASSNSWWQSIVDSTSEALTLADLSSVYNQASVGNDMPDMALTTRTLWERYESLLQPQQRFSDSKTAEAGFMNLMYKGAPVCFDTYCTSGSWYFLNSKYLKLVRHSDKWMSQTPFQTAVQQGQDAKYALILSYGNLTLSNRSRHGLLSNKTA
jgi:hypothetical protein